MTTAPSAAAVWAALSTVYLAWGSTYLAIRIVVEDLPPLLSMGIRFVLAGLILGALVVARGGRAVLRVPRRAVAAAGLVGMLLLLGGNGGVAIAEQTVPSGLAALLVAATPLWLVVLRTVTGDRPVALSLLGTLLGFAGIGVLARPGGVDGDVQTWGLIAVVGATMSWAVGSFASARLPLPGDPFVAAVFEMLIGGALMLLAATAAGEWADFAPAAVSTRSWLWLAYLVVVGSIAAFSAYVWLLGNAPLSLTATYAYVNPVVAVALGALVLDEAVTAQVVIGGLVVVLGVALIVSRERLRRRGSRAPERSQGQLPAAERVT